MIDTETLPAEEVVEKPLAEEVEEETAEELKKRSRKPPNEGKCKICDQFKPLNRHKICYACYVKENLRKDGWAGGPHPDSCGCTGLGGHETKKSEGN